MGFQQQHTFALHSGESARPQWMKVQPSASEIPAEPVDAVSGRVTVGGEGAGSTVPCLSGLIRSR